MGHFKWRPKCFSFCWQQHIYCNNTEKALLCFHGKASRNYYIADSDIWTSTTQREYTVAFPRQQWLRERATVLRSTHTAYLFLNALAICFATFITVSNSLIYSSFPTSSLCLWTSILYCLIFQYISENLNKAGFRHFHLVTILQFHRNCEIYCWRQHKSRDG
jgi:hypothetical protein